MAQKIISINKSNAYSAAITREQFLFHEMRITAKLRQDGLSNEEIVEKIVSDNLFQYPTEKSVRRISLSCLKRLDILDDENLTAAIVDQPSNVGKQICLYAMMKQYRLVWNFMITVVGNKYKLFDASFGKIDLNTFFIRLQAQNGGVASWSDSTIKKLKQMLTRMSVANEYIYSTDERLIWECCQEIR